VLAQEVAGRRHRTTKHHSHTTNSLARRSLRPDLGPDPSHRRLVIPPNPRATARRRQQPVDRLTGNPIRSAPEPHRCRHRRCDPAARCSPWLGREPCAGPLT
jgi:hypothetical protein